MSEWYCEDAFLPARVIGASAGQRVSLLVCPGVEKEWGGDEPLEVPAELIAADDSASGTDLLIGWDGPEEVGPPTWAIRLPCYELRVCLPGPFVLADAAPLTDRVVPAITAALKRRRLGPKVLSWATPVDSPGPWHCWVWAHDLRRAVTVLREVLTELAVQADTRIEVCPKEPPFRVVRSYTLTPRGEAEDWGDFADVDQAARLPPSRAIAMHVPCTRNPALRQG